MLFVTPLFFWLTTDHTTIHMNSIYNLHPAQASPRLHVDDSLTKKLLLRIRSEDPEPGWFDEVTFDFLKDNHVRYHHLDYFAYEQVAAVVHNELQQNEKFLSDFKRSVGYLKVIIIISVSLSQCMIIAISQGFIFDDNYCMFPRAYFCYQSSSDIVMIIIIMIVITFFFSFWQSLIC